MIPLRDTTKSGSFPIVNTIFIALNIAVFIYEIWFVNDTRLFLYRYGLVPAVVTTDLEIGIISRVYPFFTSMFLHAGWMHIIGNMIFLYIFGDNIEHRMGHIKYLFFYILTGTIAALIQFLININSTIPIVGASGAISGVLGAYLLFFPKSRILTVVPILFFIRLIHLPATVFIFVWFLIQFLGGISSAGRASDVGGVAFWAHLGGFAAGLILARHFDKLKYYSQKSFNGYYKN
jgi:membrane associated rhomboid family serine protease